MARKDCNTPFTVLGEESRWGVLSLRAHNLFIDPHILEDLNRKEDKYHYFYQRE